MYKARLCSSQEIPPFRLHFPCSELLRGASEGAVAKSAQVSGKQGTCKQIGALKEQNRSGGLRNPALAAAVWSRGWDLATDSITSHLCSLSLVAVSASKQLHKVTAGLFTVLRKKKEERGQIIDFCMVLTI